MICAPIGHNQLRPAMAVNPKTVSLNTSVANPVGGSKSMSFPGNNTGVCVQIDDTRNPFASGGLSAGTNDFTMECWFRPSAVLTSGEQYIFEQSYGGPVIFLNGNKYALGWSMNSVLTTTSSVIAINTWYHAALTKSSGTSRLFLNGTQQWSSTSNYNFTQTSVPGTTYVAGGLNSGSLSCLYNGLICEARISTIARYTANFTPPSTPFVDDQFTALLIHGDGANGSNAISDDNT